MKRLVILTIFCTGAFAQTVAKVGYTYPSPVTVAPGQVVTVFLAGNIQGDVSVNLHQISDYNAPVLSVAPGTAFTAITIQMPYEMIPTCFYCATIANFAAELIVTVNGTALPQFDLTPLADRIHFLTTCDTVVSGGSGIVPFSGLPCAPYVTHADGSLVAPDNPAHPDEVLVAYAAGLGATTPAAATGQAAPASALANETFILTFDYLANALPAQPVRPPLPALLTKYATPLFAGLTAGYIGLYQVNFVVQPPDAGLSIASCQGLVQSNLTVSMGGLYSFDGVGICVAQ